MSTTAHNLIQFFPDIVISFLFLRTVSHEVHPAPGRAVAAALSLAATLLLYAQINIGNFFRFSYRSLCYFAFLRLLYRIEWKRCAYFSLFACTCWAACQNILFTPMLFPIVVQGDMGLSVSPFMSELVSMAIRVTCMASPLFVVAKLVPFRNITGPNSIQWVVIMFIILCEMYVKQVSNNASRLPGEHPLESILFPVFLQLFLLGFLVVFERGTYIKKQQEEIRVQEIINYYRFRNLESKQKGDTDLRQLYHDIKNHLLAINALSQGENSRAVKRYIDSLLQSMQNYEIHVETGNQVLNGLLSQKLEEAERHHIDMSLILNFQQINFIEDMDLCTLFGNAVDNAIEACDGVPENERQILIRSQESIGQLIISVNNSYRGEIAFDNGLPCTSKLGGAEHGIGLRNIQRVLKKYGGTIDIDVESEYWFKLTMLIPLQ